ncbi:MAG: bacillithiol biosynthesis BshC, partial [Emcibacteraceae bacterium]|nr:bacillithiol biosynthesis BshC [Emcibacteraceae bacterium]
QIESLEQKLLRAEKSKFEKSLKQMDQIKDRLFPNGGLQERSANFFNFCSDGKVQEHLLKMKEALDPFEKDFTVFYF